MLVNPTMDPASKKGTRMDDFAQGNDSTSNDEGSQRSQDNQFKKVIRHRSKYISSLLPDMNLLSEAPREDAPHARQKAKPF